MVMLYDIIWYIIQMLMLKNLKLNEKFDIKCLEKLSISTDFKFGKRFFYLMKLNCV